MTIRVLDGGAGHLLTVRAAAARLGVSTATIYKLCASGSLPHVRVSNAIRLAPADLDTFITNQKRGSGGAVAHPRRSP